MLVKANALDLLRKELAHKRIKGYIGTGSMNDPDQPLERLIRKSYWVCERNHRRVPLPLIRPHQERSDPRDMDLLVEINERAAGGASGPTKEAGMAGAVVSFTVTTVDDDLAWKLESGAPSPSRRVAALAAFAERGIRTGIMLMPVLPFIEDTVENVTGVVMRADERGVTDVVPGFGMTLRDPQRLYYYRQLDRLFPGLRGRYERAFGERYHAGACGASKLEAIFDELTTRHGLLRAGAPPYRTLEDGQLALF